MDYKSLRLKYRAKGWKGDKLSRYACGMLNTMQSCLRQYGSECQTARAAEDNPKATAELLAAGLIFKTTKEAVAADGHKHTMEIYKLTPEGLAYQAPRF